MQDYELVVQMMFARQQGRVQEVIHNHIKGMMGVETLKEAIKKACDESGLAVLIKQEELGIPCSICQVNHSKEGLFALMGPEEWVCAPCYRKRTEKADKAIQQESQMARHLEVLQSRGPRRIVVHTPEPVERTQMNLYSCFICAASFYQKYNIRNVRTKCTTCVIEEMNRVSANNNTVEHGPTINSQGECVSCRLMDGGYCHYHTHNLQY